MEKSKRKLYDGEHVYNFRELINRYAKYNDKLAFIYKKHYNDKIYIKKTYTQFHSDIEACGNALLSLGLRKKRIAVIAPNRYEWCVSYLGITTADIIVVPLDKSLPNNEIESLIIRSEIDAIVFDQKYTDIIKKVFDEKKSNLKYLINMDLEADSDNMISYSKLLEKGQEIAKQSNNEYSNIEIDNDAMAIMLFTSGTTSISKAVMLSQANICADVYALDCMTDIREDDIFLSFLPLHHTFESSCTFLYGTFSGITIAFCDGLKHVAKNLKEYNITGFVAVPIMLEIMYKKLQKGLEEQHKTKLFNNMRKISNNLLKMHIDIRRKMFKPILNKIGGNLRILIAGGAPMNKEAIQGFVDMGINLLQGYGLTETSPVLAGENDKYKRAGSVGFALPTIDIEIANPNEDGIGEIIAKGPTIMQGYYNNDEATKEVLKNGWFYTGDLGYFDKDGYLFVTGRKKYVIVLKNGKNIYPEELEILVNKLPYVDECMVYGKPDKDEDLKICIKVVYKKDYMKETHPDLSKEQYYDLIWADIKNINKTMPAYKYIREMIITDEPLIKTTTQKIKRHEELKKILDEEKNNK